METEKQKNRRYFITGMLFNLLLVGLYFGTEGTINNYYNNTTGSNGTLDHAVLTNLTWSNAGHIINTDLNYSGYSLYNVNNISKYPYDYPKYKLSFDDQLISLFVGDSNLDKGQLDLTRNNLTYYKDGNMKMLINNSGNFFIGIDLMGNNLSNCLNCQINHDSKVNKTGDTITGSIVYNPHTVDMVRFSNWVSSTDSFYGITNHSNTIMAMHSLTNDTGVLETQYTNFFGAYKSSYDTTTQRLRGLPADTSIFNFYGKGYDGSTFGSSAVNIELKTDYAWNTTSHSTKMNFYTKSRADSKSITMTLSSDKKVNVPGLAGSGNAYVCVDASGTLYRGSPTC